MKSIEPQQIFSLSEFLYNDIFGTVEYPWEILNFLGDYIKSVIEPNISCKIVEGVVIEGEEIEIGEGSVIEPPAYIKAPCIIGKNVQIRAGAYIRGNVLVGDGTVVGHSTEVKNALLMNSVEVPHFNYIGDWCWVIKHTLERV
jgi:NDP-sugar pyrophosphorylase family protein